MFCSSQGEGTPPDSCKEKLNKSMNYIQSFLYGICFVAGIVAGVAAVSKWTRKTNERDNEWQKKSIMDTNDLLRQKVAVMERIAVVLEFWLDREKKKEFHGE